MKILYYYWNENSANDIIETFNNLGHSVDIVELKFDNYNTDTIFYSKFSNYVNQRNFDIIFSFDFFPIISEIAKEKNLPYFSWIYDMPHTTLYSPVADNDTNYIFVFDRNQYYELCSLYSSAHIYHLPLAVNTRRLFSFMGEPSNINGQGFDVSFVGSLYEKCLYNQINYLPEDLRKSLEHIINLQKYIYDSNVVSKLLTDDLVDKLKKWVKLEIASNYNISIKAMYENILLSKITSQERIDCLSEIAKIHHLTLFSASNVCLIPNAHKGGILSYETEMPIAFRSTKINMNITLRSITSGIPLRALDIMGAGGFLLSNYQKELDNFFVDEKELVLFHNIEDMLEKIAFYLSHESERLAIAQRGFSKVNQNFSYEVQVKKMLEKLY